MILHKRIYPRLFFLLLACLLIGCGKSAQVTQLVEGVVTLDGVPLEDASIAFVPKSSEGTVAGGYSSFGGKYKIQTIHGAPGMGTTPGEYVVTVKKMESAPTGKKIKNEDGETIDEMTEWSVTPEIYASQNTTPLVVNVVEGNNKIDLELNSSTK